MYEPVKTFYMGSNPGEAPFITKVAIAQTTLGSAVHLLLSHMMPFLNDLGMLEEQCCL